MTRSCPKGWHLEVLPPVTERKVVMEMSDMRLLVLCVCLLCLAGCETTSERRQSTAPSGGLEQVTVGGTIKVRAQHLDAR